MFFNVRSIFSSIQTNVRLNYVFSTSFYFFLIYTSVESAIKCYLYAIKPNKYYYYIIVSILYTERVYTMRTHMALYLQFMMAL